MTATVPVTDLALYGRLLGYVRPHWFYFGLSLFGFAVYAASHVAFAARRFRRFSHRIQDAMNEVMKGRPTLVIARRLSTIEGADRILVMEQGCIVEDGRHAELLADHGPYARLQRREFAEDTEPADSTHG